jgi:predicted RNA binding protein YcfA (HicA-like mRNA interferase family)
MPKTYPAKWIIAVLQKHGFVFVSQKGSHAKYRVMRNGKTVTVIVPVHRQEIPYGTFHAIIQQSGLSKEDFEE